MIVAATEIAAWAVADLGTLTDLHPRHIVFQLTRPLWIAIKKRRRGRTTLWVMNASRSALFSGLAIDVLCEGSVLKSSDAQSSAEPEI
jgi:hypothetical protein